jgi:hypothetical protein
MTLPRHNPTLLARAATVLGAFFVALFAGCDNPACVFGPAGCTGGVGGAGSAATSASFPEQGEWIAPGAPQVVEFFPKGTASAATPIVLVFNESISPASIERAFELSQAGGLPTGPAALASSLVGDGRVLVLFPPPLVAGLAYEIRWSEGTSVRDLTGSLALRPSNGVAGSFSVEAESDGVPELLLTWPLDSSTNQGTQTEIVTIFDTLLDPTSVLPTSWRVLVDGVPPAFNPSPQMLSIDTGGFGQPSSTQEPRVWTWRSVDPATGAAVSLGTGVEITVELSPAGGTAITTPDDEALAPVSHSFTTMSFSAPLVASLQSDPSDAIGNANLTGSAPLMLQVDLEEPALAGDTLSIWEFGTLPGSTGPDPDDPGGPPLPGVILALARSFDLDAGISSVLLEEAQLNLVDSSNAARFLDGDLGFAFSVTRDGATSPLRVLDVDAEAGGIQDALLDTDPPAFIALAGLVAGENDYRTDARDLVVMGRADEVLRTALVTAHLSGGPVDNTVGGALPPLPALDSSGEFIAAAVSLDAVAASELPLNFDLVVYDRALNPSPVFAGRWTQLGSSGPALPLPGSGFDVTVTVYDSVTLAAIEGAVIHSHEVDAGALTSLVLPTAVTDASGTATIQSAPTGETLLTVEAVGYDLFSFQGVRTDRLGVPMTSESTANLAAVVRPAALSEGTDLNSSFLTTWAADSRVFSPQDAAYQGINCFYNPLVDQTFCGFAPQVIQAGRAGTLSFLATKEPANQSDPSGFSAASFLQAFEARFPRPAVQAGGFDDLTLAVGPLLSGAGVDPADVPLGVPALVLEKPVGFALAFPSLVGPPLVTVDVVTTGLVGAMTVGMGKAYENIPGDNYDLRAAYSALARAAGPLVGDGLMRDERFVRAEFVDLGGARTGVRQPLSGAVALVQPLTIPQITAPVAPVTGKSYPVVFDDVIDGALDEKGLVRVSLRDDLGRSWHIWQPDPTGSGSATIFLPPIELQGGIALADGTITAVLSAWAWPDYDPTDFLFSDPGREHNQFLTGQITIWQQVP